jgi:hypothetical protein
MDKPTSDMFVFQCIYGCYVHSAILPTFHRRCYWLLQVRSLIAFKFISALIADPVNDCAVNFVLFVLSGKSNLGLCFSSAADEAYTSDVTLRLHILCLQSVCIYCVINSFHC